jgi:hypothetical protein
LIDRRRNIKITAIPAKKSYGGNDLSRISMADADGDLEDSLGATVGDIPNRYTSDVVLNQQARVAHQGWYGGFAIPGGPVAEGSTAVLDAGAYGGSGDKPMAGY